jgi:uncharacterized protein with GYD domain
MATYIVLVNFTDRGIRDIKHSPERAKVMTTAADRLGIKVKDIHWTLGAHDAVVIVDAPNDEAIMALAMGTGSLGNIRTQTLRAFSTIEMNNIIAKMP